ncbi:dihydroxyacetone phosphate acyltransferase-like [Littorina saxatilis]|uniref:Phospholipid/glycerol acyltransferase domain-containing protein n=1 Tax=Littorina saxatilis TaxID=31220 RepID=A0AAN9BCJ9_9CAEN
MSEQSRNAWITKDDPKLVSSKHKDNFEDILEDRRHNSDLRYCSRTRDVPSFRLNKKRTPQQVKEHVLKSDRVQYAVEQVCVETQLPRTEVLTQAASIVDEMAHNLRLGAVRGFAYFLMKVLKQLYQRIYVNEEGVEKVRSLIQDYPVLIMPTHRSYMDFLLMSYVFYHYDLPLPVIAAAMDFMGMKFFGWLLRNCGAFYIRRSFGEDSLYWAVFTEYVQTQICNGDTPIEFYVEGTRSRTSKSYTPKFGMLSAALEPYFKSQVSDIMVIPVSISYDRVLEESLYAYELLGVPKPKESTSGLLKARKILEEDFGNIHITFGEPVSIRKFSDGKVDRSMHSLAPRYIVSLTQEEQSLIRTLGYHMVLVHQHNMVISPWSMVAAVLMQSQQGVTVRSLVHEVDWVKRLASNLGAYIDWPVNESAEAIIRHSLALHPNIVSVGSDDVVTLLQVSPPVAHGRSAQQQQIQQFAVMQNAAQHIMLSLYRNQAIHVFLRPAMVSLAINSCKEEELSLDLLYQKYVFLENVLCRDFVFIPGNTRKDFEHTLATLAHIGVVVVEAGAVVVKKSTNKTTAFLSHMFEPFLLGYWLMCQFLLSSRMQVAAKPLARTQKTLTREMQVLAARLIQEETIRHFEILSLDMANNCLHALFHMGGISKEKRDGVTYMYPNVAKLSTITEQLGTYTAVPPLPAVSINLNTKTVTVNAKL